MKRNALEPSAFDIADRAFRLVRSAPPAALFLYFLGAVPFCLGLLCFWDDVSRAVGARERLPFTAGGLVFLYAWMKGCHALYALRLRRELEQTALERWGPGRLLRLFARQAVLQPLRFLAVPAAALAMVPFGWVHAFYENLTVLADRDGLVPLAREAWAEARLWPRQNHLLIWLLSPFLLLSLLGGILGCLYLAAVLWPHHQPDAITAFLIGLAALLVALPFSPLGVIVWGNLFAVLMAAPFLLHMLGGIETVFTLSGFHVLSTTFLLAVSVLAYLVLDPVLKAAYVLRCVEGRARFTGNDLLLSLRSLRRGAAGVAVPLLILGTALLPVRASAQEPERLAPEIHASVPPDALRAAVEKVLARPEFSWRASAQADAAMQDGLSGTLLDGVGSWIRAHFGKKWNSFWKWVEGVVRWLEKWFHRSSQVSDAKIGPSSIRWEFVAAGGAAAVLLGALFLFWRRQVARRAVAIPVAVVVPAPDLHDESVLPTDMPLDAWMRLAEELQAKGEFRLALRALYFSMLAALAERGAIRVGRSKSNCDYLIEAGRRGHGSPLESLLRDNLAAFERSWYGHHAVDAASLARFCGNREAMLAAL